MKFIKSNSPPESSFPMYDGMLVNQYIYTLPNVSNQLWYENRDSYHTDFRGSFANTIETFDGIAGYGISPNESYRNGIVILNSSTASGASEDNGSNSRYADNNVVFWHTIRDGWKRGTLMFFPEHSDYDTLDWFKINQPYLNTAQGSSGNESPQVYRCTEMIQALQPEVREWLIANERVGDVMSYLMRSNYPGGYLNPLAHRVVTSMGQTSTADTTLAASITLGTIPPKLSIQRVSDNKNNQIVITDELIGLRRSDTDTRTIQVSLRSDKSNCTYHWIKSQGECTITFQNPEKSLATITIPFQPTFVVKAQDGHDIESNRVEITAVAYDGTHYSSPVFVTEYITPDIRTPRVRMDEIAVHADNSFKLKLNGIEVLYGNDWQRPYSIPVTWAETNLVEIEVVNRGGPGGLLAALFVGTDLQVTDSSWETSLDQVNWVAPMLIPHNRSPWVPAGMPSLPSGWADKGAVWLWHPQAIETSTVYFRKTVGAVVPTPTPQPVPTPEPTPQPIVGDFERRITALESTISKLKDVFR